MPIQNSFLVFSLGRHIFHPSSDARGCGRTFLRVPTNPLCHCPTAARTSDYRPIGDRKNLRRGREISEGGSSTSYPIFGGGCETRRGRGGWGPTGKVRWCVARPPKEPHLLCFQAPAYPSAEYPAGAKGSAGEKRKMSRSLDEKDRSSFPRRQNKNKPGDP